MGDNLSPFVDISGCDDNWMERSKSMISDIDQLDGNLSIISQSSSKCDEAIPVHTGFRQNILQVDGNVSFIESSFQGENIPTQIGHRPVRFNFERPPH